MHRAGEFRNAQASRLLRVPGVQRVDPVLAVFDEGAAASRAAAEFTPIRRVKILAKIDAIRCDEWEQLLESPDLLLHRVPAVVDQDVDLRQGLGKFAQEFSVTLIANEYLDPRFFEPTA